jgi:protein involved in polysaccharide export with SLBB domain/Flp pilus assembly protein TadD
MKIAPLLSVALLLASSSAYVSAQTGSTSSLKPVAAVETHSSGNSGGQVEAQKTYDAALALYEAGKLEEAITALKEATKARPDDAQSLFLLGMAYSQAKAYKDAAESFKRAVRFKPDWPEAHFRLGMIYYVLGRRSQSIDEYKKLLELNSPLANTLDRIIKDVSDPANVAESVRVDSEVSATKPAEPVAVPASASVSSRNESPAEIAGVPSSKSESSKSPAPAPSSTSVVNESTLTNVYRIGVGDVLDIRLLNSSVNRSSLYSVIDGGLIDLPIAGGAIRVAGLTTEEIQARIAGELKRRAVEEGAQVSVGVRQYSSHSIIITGLVSNQGTKVLRREAVPLYVILAEAQPRLDAARVAIMRTGAAAQVVDLSDSASLSFLVRPGDVLNVTARPQEFYYIAGRVNFPGQKVFQPGITLIQAILAAGGVVRASDNSIEVSREGANGLLSTMTLSLKEIKSGKIQDPKLRPGDRIEVVN